MHTSKLSAQEESAQENVFLLVNRLVDDLIEPDTPHREDGYRLASFGPTLLFRLLTTISETRLSNESLITRTLRVSPLVIKDSLNNLVSKIVVNNLNRRVGPNDARR